MIYQIVDWAATYIECFVLLAAIAQISGKKLAGIKHILLLCLFSLTDCILVATLNSIQSFSFLTPIASILFCFFVSAGFSTGKVALRAAACIMTVFVILAIGYIWMIFVCILHGGRFEDRDHCAASIWLWTNPLTLQSTSSFGSVFIGCPH